MNGGTNCLCLTRKIESLIGAMMMCQLLKEQQSEDQQCKYTLTKDAIGFVEPLGGMRICGIHPRQTHEFGCVGKLLCTC